MLSSISDSTIAPGTRVLLRANLNVPRVDGRIADDARITSALATITWLCEHGARTIIIGHTSTDGASLEQVCAVLAQHVPVVFVTDALSDAGRATIDALKNGECVLVENIRNNPGEERATDSFAQELASLADIFVQDDFSVAHRTHASVVGVPKYLPSYMGMQFAREYEELSRAFNPEHPSLLILGGAKSDTKMPIAISLADVMDEVFITGVSGNTLLKVQGRNVGSSVVDAVPHSILMDVVAKENVFSYSDVLAVDADGDEYVASSAHVDGDSAIMDAGPETTAHIVHAIASARFVLWNGPLGYYEKGYTTATHEIARALAHSSAVSIIGGGDTVAAISALGLEKEFTFISTAGGAMLEFLAKKTLPGIEALKK